ncbi:MULTISPECIES: DUF6159 family protein [unclassified Streptomyces]|uniref:DUF6159 family protein n=1 Tax=unclassified Streptomyces TaxID=2593676 RepID=UPI0038242FBB
MLRRRPALLCFPALNAVVLAVLLLIAWLQPLRGIWERARLDQAPTTGQFMALLVLFFLLSGTSTYFTAALLHSVHALGQDLRPAVRVSLRAALRRLPTLLAWCLLGSSLGMVLRVLESTAGVSWIFELAGTSWSLWTFFVLPVIVVEGTGLFTGLRRSMTLGRAELGNWVAGGIRLALTTVLVVIIAIIALILAVETDSVTVLVAAAGCVVALFLATGLLSATASGIYRMALYQRAVARRPA